VANASEVDDLVQDCLERLLRACGRLAPETVLPFGIVTARNLVASRARTAARQDAAGPRLPDVRDPDHPEEVVLTREARRAMTAALARLSPQERGDILAYHDETSRAAVARPGESAGALRIRMSRTRAKLRLEYLLVFRGIDLPTEQCRKVLIAVSGSDARRQRALDAGRHLLDCDIRAALCEPLERRSIALTAVSLPAGLAAWILGKARAHPAQAAASAAGIAALAAAAVLAAGILASPAPAARPQLAVPASAPAARSSLPVPAAGAIPGLRIGGQSVDVRGSLTALVGRPVSASQVVVQSVVTLDGFWVGTPGARLWVELVGPLRSLQIVAGDRVSFTGTVAGNGPAYPRRTGVTGTADAGLLNRQGAHLSAGPVSVRVHPRS
jgi:RNA polymerase sigma factor (sigma-70 family)